MKYQIFSGVAVAAGILLVAASPASLAAGSPTAPARVPAQNCSHSTVEIVPHDHELFHVCVHQAVQFSRNADGLHLSTDNKAVFHVSRSETDGSTDSPLGGFAAQHGTAHVFIKKDGRVLFHMTIIVD